MYDNQVAKIIIKWATAWLSEMKSQVFDRMDPVFIIGLLLAFDMA